MRSTKSPHHFVSGFRRTPNLSSCFSSSHTPASRSLVRSFASLRCISGVKQWSSEFSRLSCNRRCGSFAISSVDEDSIAFSFEHGDEVDEWDDYYVISSSEDEDNSTDLLVNPSGEVDLPTIKDHPLQAPDSALTVAAYRFASIQRGQRKNRRLQGVIITVGLLAFLVLFLLFIDSCAWKMTRLPLEPFYLTHPFSISAVLSACAGWLYIPIADSLKIHPTHKREWPIKHSSKRVVPTMGGLSFVPIGIIVARVVGICSIEVNGATAVTIAFAAVGLLVDILSGMRSYSYGLLLDWVMLFLQVASGTWFAIWLEGANVSTPYSMKMLVPLPLPHGLVYVGKKYYRVLTAFCFAAMGYGVNLTDGFNGLAGGVAAVAFIGMSVAVLPISPDLSVFGASMAGACIGFLFHNRYKASMCMGRIGSLALSGALAASAASTGMFLPLFISAGVLMLEIISVLVQVLPVLFMKSIYRKARYFFQLAPLHYHLRLYGLREPHVVACAYTVSCIMAVFAGYVGLVSA